MVVLGLVMDQLSKALAVYYLGNSSGSLLKFLPYYFSLYSVGMENFPFRPFRPPYHLLGDWLSFNLTLNDGAAWSILAGYPRLLALFSALLITLLVFYWYRVAYREPFANLGLILIVAGAMGNFVDRLRLAVVVDFIDVLIPLPGRPPWDFPVFNVADSLASIGVLLVLFSIFLSHSQEEKRQSDAPEGGSEISSPSSRLEAEIEPGEAES